MLADDPAGLVYDRAGPQRLGCLSFDEAGIVIVGHEADLHALGLVGHRQLTLSSEASDLALRERTDGEQGRAQLILGQAKQEVRLVLPAIAAHEQARAAP